ncbi:MAG: alpha-E domain-containing protein [Clostridia bacterium]
MGTVTLNKHNRLFWLGRYAERVYQGVETIHKIQDQAIDGEPINLEEISKKMGVSNKFESVEDFCIRMCFDRKIPESILCAADAMLGNGMVLREILGSQTLSYLQMAVSALESASNSSSPAVQFQWVLDDIMAFRGSYAEFIESEEIRNTIKSGASIERISSMIRLNFDQKLLKKEIHKLMNRLYKTNVKHSDESLDAIKEFAFNEEESFDSFKLLCSVETLFLI